MLGRQIAIAGVGQTRPVRRSDTGLRGLVVEAIEAALADAGLQPGDIEEGLNAASAIGDDMIQRKTQGRVVPDAFTHGTSEQRVRWFTVGYRSGRMQDCDTFSAAGL